LHISISDLLRHLDGILAIHPRPFITVHLLLVQSYPMSSRMALHILVQLLRYEDLRNMDVLSIA
jgi:hypothetical protein